MAFTSFQIITAARLNLIQPIVYSATQSGNAGNSQTITTSQATCLGCTATFSTATAANWLAIAHFDFQASGTGAATAAGRLVVDSVTQSKEAHLSGDSVTRSTPGMVWSGAFSGSGSHTISLAVIKTAAAATLLCLDQHTTVDIIVSEIV